MAAQLVGSSLTLINGFLIAKPPGTRKSDGRYWARRGDAFLKGSFNSLSAAQYAAEYGEDGEDYFDDEDTWGTP